MVPVGFLLYGAYESKGNVLVLIGSKWFEKFFRGWDGIDIAIYAVVSTIADTILLQVSKIKNSPVKCVSRPQYIKPHSSHRP